MATPGIRMQVVNDVTAAEDQNALLRSVPQPRAEGVVESRRLRLSMLSCTTGTSACGYGDAALTSCRDRGPRSNRRSLAAGRAARAPACERRFARGRIAHCEQLAREAAEVMDGSRRRHGGHGGAGDEPVRRDRQHAARARQHHTERRPGACLGIVMQRVHRVAVPEKQRRHQRTHDFRAWGAESSCTAI